MRQHATLRPVLPLAAGIVILAASVSGIARQSGPPAKTADRGVMLMNRIGPSSSELYVAKADGTEERKLFPASSFDLHGSYSPDGAWVVFTSERNGLGQADIYRAHPDGTGVELLTDSPALDDQGALSPDGTRLAFVSTRETRTANIWILDLPTRQLHNLTGQPGATPPNRTASSAPPSRRTASGSPSRPTATLNGAGTAAAPAGSTCKTSASTSFAPTAPVFAGSRRPDRALARPSGRPTARASSSTSSRSSRRGRRTGRAWTRGRRRRSCRLTSTRGTAPSTPPGRASRSCRSSCPAAPSATSPRPGRHRGSPTPAAPAPWPATDVFPSFSKDGKLLLTRKDGDSSLDIMDPDGSNRQEVFASKGGAAFSPSWSPDGQSIVFGYGGFLQLRSRQTAKIMMVKRDGTDATSLTDGTPNAGFPSWSPDGTHIVYRVWGEGVQGLRILNMPDRSSRVLTTDYDNLPYWSPDGQRIVFTRRHSGFNFDIFSIKPDGTDVRQLTTSPANDAHAVWTDDGQQIMWNSGMYGWREEAALYDKTFQPYGQVFIMNADGSGKRQLTDSLWEDSMPRFVPRVGRGMQ